jgi:tRNA-Thr(GGU) m(6)t(6)A37 methyltransferase TsaA
MLWSVTRSELQWLKLLVIKYANRSNSYEAKPARNFNMDSMQIVFRPVGIVRTKASDDEMREEHKDVESTIEILPEFHEALEGLEGFSHIFVLSHLNKLRPEQVGKLKVRPLRLLRKGYSMEELPYVGVFAIDSPTRPNPIGLSLVTLIKIEANRLLVRGLDLFDGTPVLDIKPYRDDYRAAEHRLAEWYRKIREKAGEEV